MEHREVNPDRSPTFRVTTKFYGAPKGQPKSVSRLPIMMSNQGHPTPKKHRSGDTRSAETEHNTHKTHKTHNKSTIPHPEMQKQYTNMKSGLRPPFTKGAGAFGARPTVAEPIIADEKRSNGDSK